MTNCPDCDCKLNMSGATVGDILSCPECGLELEVIFKDGKLQVKELVISGEDWGNKMKHDFNKITIRQSIPFIFIVALIVNCLLLIANITPNLGIQLISIIILSIATVISALFNDFEDWYGEHIGSKWLHNLSKLFATIAMILALVVVFIGCICNVTYSREYSSNTYPMYSITAPFGVIYTDTSGSVSGYNSLFFGSISGSMSTQASEDYVAKYMVDDRLYSITVEAKDNPIVVDGNFSITVNVYETYTWNTYWDVPSLRDPRYEATFTKYVIHIPELPKIEQSLTKDYTILP